MLQLIKNIKEKYVILKSILKLTDKKIKIIFYSESKFDQKFSRIFARKQDTKAGFDYQNNFRHRPVRHGGVGDGVNL